MSQYARVERWDGDKGRGREYPEIGAVTERQEHQVDADHDVDVDVRDAGDDDADPDADADDEAGNEYGTNVDIDANDEVVVANIRVVVLPVDKE